jgi:ribosomal protein S27AE
MKNFDQAIRNSDGLDSREYLERQKPHCPKCGEQVLGDENNLCGYCAGEFPEAGDAF